MDNGYTNHITYKKLFKHLDKSFASEVKIGNGDFVDVLSKGKVAVDTPTSAKIILDILFVPEISENLSSVGQMLKKIAL